MSDKCKPVLEGDGTKHYCCALRLGMTGAEDGLYLAVIDAVNPEEAARLFFAKKGHWPSDMALSGSRVQSAILHAALLERRVAELEAELLELKQEAQP